MAVVVATSAAMLGSGCLNVISGDNEWVDEFAAFKATGGRCTGNGEPIDVDAELQNVTRYRWVAYGGLLGEVVSDRGRVYYDDLASDVELLDNARRTVAAAASVNPENLEGFGEKLAFWLNAYNALVLLAATTAYAEDAAFSVDTNGFAFFDRNEHVVGGRTYSLNVIEHGVLRGTPNHISTALLPADEQEAVFALHDNLWGDVPFEPRFHFALNCASSSCPELLDRPFRGETIDEDLNFVTDAFLHDDEKGAGPNGISSLFDFYFDDFEAVGGPEAFISQYRDVSEVNLFSYLPYDWSLNREDPAVD